MRIEVDRDLCEANAICVGIAPDIVSLGDDDLAHVRDGDVPADREAEVCEAIVLSPKVALSLQHE